MGGWAKAFHIPTALAVVLFAVPGLASQAAQGQELAPMSPATQPGKANTGVVEKLTETVWLAPGQSKVIEAPWRATRVSITDPTIADVKTLSPTQVLLVGKAVGTTDLLVWNEKEEVRRTKVQVMVADLEVLSGELRRLFPDTTLQLSPSGRAIVLTGQMARADQVVQLHRFFEVRKLDYVDMTSVPGVQQVQIQVRVAEVSRQAIKSLGLNATFIGDDFVGADFVGADGGGPINPTAFGPGAGTTTISPAVTVFGRFPHTDLSLFLQALAENQYLRILAEPNLTALSGEKASFLAGGEFPIPIVQTATVGASALTIEYKEFGVRLMFQPVVLGENRIKMLVAPEVSELSDVGAVTLQGFRIPGLVTRKFETTLELASGQTFAMAGLLQRSSSGRTSRIPGVGDIPVLGALFRSVRYSEGETELMVLVTASLVEPSSTKISSYVLPGDTHARPNDWEIYALGHLEGKGPARVTPEQARWLDETGLYQLRGPGAWAYYSSPAPMSDMKEPSGGATAAPQPMTPPSPEPAAPKVESESQAPAPAAAAEPTVENAAAVSPPGEAKTPAPEGQSN